MIDDNAPIRVWFTLVAPSSRCCSPLEQAFWEWLLTSAVKDWGLTTYEQDWLYNELGGVEILQTDVNAARTWLTQMNGGAAAAGVTVQYCMP